MPYIFHESFQDLTTYDFNESFEIFHLVIMSVASGVGEGESREYFFQIETL